MLISMLKLFEPAGKLGPTGFEEAYSTCTMAVRASVFIRGLLPALAMYGGLGILARRYPVVSQYRMLAAITTGYLYTSSTKQEVRQIGTPCVRGLMAMHGAVPEELRSIYASKYPTSTLLSKAREGAHFAATHDNNFSWSPNGEPVPAHSKVPAERLTNADPFKALKYEYWESVRQQIVSKDSRSRGHSVGLPQGAEAATTPVGAILAAASKSANASAGTTDLEMDDQAYFAEHFGSSGPSAADSVAASYDSAEQREAADQPEPSASTRSAQAANAGGMQLSAADIAALRRRGVPVPSGSEESGEWPAGERQSSLEHQSWPRGTWDDDRSAATNATPSWKQPDQSETDFDPAEYFGGERSNERAW